MLLIHKATMDDAPALVHFIKQLDEESEYLLYEAGERRTSLASVRLYLEKIQNNPKQVVIIATRPPQKIIGFICAENPTLKRSQHILKVSIGVLAAYRRLGVAKQLIQAFEKHMTENNIKRLEATVIDENIASMQLLQRAHFKMEGIKKHSIQIGNRYHDEYLFALVRGI